MIKSKYKFDKKIIFPVVVSLLIYLASFLGVFYPLQSRVTAIGHSILQPLASIWVGMKDGIEVLQELQGIEAENDSLKDEVLKLNEQLSRFTEMTLENEYLKNLTTTVSSGTKETLLAKVLRYENIPVSGYMYIEVGEIPWVRKDLWVVYYQNIVGRIVNVDHGVAKVALITSSDFSVIVTIVGNIAELRGRSGLTADISNFGNIDIPNNSPVLLHRPDGSDMSDYMFGHISDAEERDTGGQRYITLELAYDINDLTYVQVVEE